MSEQVFRVLIVEDDERIADVNRRFVEKVSGFSVVGIATSGEEAKDWILSVQPDLVLLDIYLPDMEGTDLVWFIRGHCPWVDIIVLTAADEREVVEQALRGGVFDYIVKPLLFDRLRKSLEIYKEVRRRLLASEHLDQQVIDQIWQRNAFREGEKTERMIAGMLPKGIDALTLNKVLSYVKQSGEDGVTAESVSRVTGISRSTARRYLEFLVNIRRVDVDLVYGARGRPERRYTFRETAS